MATGSVFEILRKPEVGPPHPDTGPGIRLSRLKHLVRLNPQVLSWKTVYPELEFLDNVK